MKENPQLLYLPKKEREMLKDLTDYLIRNTNKPTQMDAILMAIRHTHGMLDRLQEKNKKDETNV